MAVARRVALALLVTNLVVWAAWAALRVGGGQTAAACALDNGLRGYQPPATEMSQTFARAGFNQLFPGDSNFALPALDSGSRTSQKSVPGYIPPVLLESIAVVESKWHQAYTDPGTVGPLTVAFDCGYGVMQVTSGMISPEGQSGTPSTYQLLAGLHYAYNVAAGAALLAGKWNLMPSYLPVIGTGDPHVAEDWYFAVWAYNGFVMRNHPDSPDLPYPRPPYDCRSNYYVPGTQRLYPYSELVWGCTNNPPVDAQGRPWFTPALQPAGKLTLPPHGSISPDVVALFSQGAQTAKQDLLALQPSHTDTTPAPGGSFPATHGQPQLQVSTRSMNVGPVGQDRDFPLVLTNGGRGLDAYLVVSNTPWIDVSPAMGVVTGADLGGAPATVTLTIHGAELPQGGAVGSVTVYSPLSASQGVQVTVTALRAMVTGANGVTRGQ